MKIRLYIDEDAADKGLIRGLRRWGIDLQTVYEAGLEGYPDEVHLDFATEQNRVLYSFNVKDFQRIHTEYITLGKSHAGIVLGKQRQFSIGQQMKRLMRLIAEKSAEQMQNNLVFLSAWGDYDAVG